MAGEYNKVIAYTGDNQDVLRKIDQIAHAQTRMTAGFGADFGRVAKVIGHDLEKIRKRVPEIVDPKTGEKATRQFETISQSVQLTDGRIGKLSETTEALNGKLVGTTYSFNETNKGLTHFEKTQASLIGKSSQLATNLDKVSDVNAKFATELKGVGQVSYLMGKNITKVSGDTKTFGTMVATSNGKILQLNETIKRTPNGIQTVSRSIRDLTSKYNANTRSTQSLNKNTVSLSQNIARLAKRAALTIPLWLLIRGAVMGVIRVFKDGINAIAEFDKKLQKARRNLQGTPQEIAKNFGILKEEVLELSLKTGIAVEDITTAFQRFATTGQDFETSMGGAIASVMLATVEFGDTVKVADSLARTYKVLGHTVKEVGNDQDKLIKISALIDELWQKNSFDIGELGKAMERFAPTANAMNIPLEETIKLLATLHSGAIVNARAGRILGNSVSRMVIRMDDLQKVLKIKINPELDTTTSVLFKVVDAFFELRKAGNFGSLREVTAILRDIFQVRGKLPIEALIALRKVLKENLAMTGDIGKFDKAVDMVTKTTGILVDRFHNANKEIGKAVVTGVVGGEDFNESLQTIVKTLEESIDKGEQFGQTMRVALYGLTLRLPSAVNAIFDNTKKLIDDNIKSISKFDQKINDALKGKLSTRELTKFISTFKDEIDKLGKATEGVFKFSEKDFIRTVGALRVQLKEQISTGLEEGLSPQQNIIQEIETSMIKRNKIAVAVLKNQLEQLEAQGALNSEILKAELLYKEQLGIFDTFDDKLERRLELEKEINEEKKLQNRLSSQSMKLYDIAQEHGTEMARKIGEVLAGQRDFNIFVRRGGEEVELMKKYFGDIFKQQQALAFFKGETVPGAKGLRGGFGIPIEEQAIRRPIDRAALVLSARRQEDLAMRSRTAQVTNNFNQNNAITQNFNINKVSNQEDFNEMAKNAFDDPSVKKKLAQLQTGNNQTNVF